MKRKIYLAITLVIAMLLITSSAGIMAQKTKSVILNNEEENIDLFQILDVPEGFELKKSVKVDINNNIKPETTPEFIKIYNEEIN